MNIQIRRHCKKIVCTGAEMSLIPSHFYHQFLERVPLGDGGAFLKVVGANGLEVPLEGYLVASLTVFGETFLAGFLVKSYPNSDSKESKDSGILLGCNVLRKLAQLVPPKFKS